jgi:hypothetical protein
LSFPIKAASANYVRKTILSNLFQTFGGFASRDGNVQGFCFSPLFGGRCSGIPKACKACANLCKDKAGQQFTVKGQAGAEHHDDSLEEEGERLR